LELLPRRRLPLVLNISLVGCFNFSLSAVAVSVFSGLGTFGLTRNRGSTSIMQIRSTKLLMWQLINEEGED
jgi:hypothetical protein